MDSSTSDLGRLLTDDYLVGLGDLDIEDLRSRKAECEQVEGELSYLRRVVQGRLDIIHAELRRREGGENGGLAEMVDNLPEILSEGGRGSSTGRLPTDMAPGTNHRLLTADLDRIIDVDTAALLPTMGQDQVAGIAEALVELEKTVSGQRNALHERLDVVKAEIVRRYKSGEATVDSLLP